MVATVAIGAVAAPAGAVSRSSQQPSAVAHTSIAPPAYKPVLHQGAHGNAVSYVQRVLNIPVTGNYGPRSVTAVKNFQLKNKISPADGVIRPTTWAALIAYAKAHPPVQAAVRAVPSGWATTNDVWAKFAPEVERFALCVAHHESWGAGLWTARSSNGLYSGAFQWNDDTWRIQSHRAGIRGYERAYQAPPDAQALTFAVAIAKYHSWSSWDGTNCGHGT
jgi:peptidoglycan hydrolase-like protein with peptidoglycan-binding domain